MKKKEVVHGIKIIKNAFYVGNRRRCPRHSSQSEAVLYLGNGLTWNHQILHEPSYWSDLLPHRIWCHYLLWLRSYLRSKNGRKWRLLRLQPRVTNFGTYIHINVLNSRARYDVTGYFQLAVIEVKKWSRMPPLMALLSYIWRTVWARIT